MSQNAEPVPAISGGRRVRRSMPLIIVVLACLALLVLWKVPLGNASPSTINMAKIVTFLIAIGALLLSILRLKGKAKKYTIGGFIVALIAFAAIFNVPSMDGNFFPIIVVRDWVQDTFFGGSPDTILENHRREQGKSDVRVELIPKPDDWPAYRGLNRDGIATGPKLSRDWAKNSPKIKWNQPIGGGYAAFSVANGFLVTIEQRRDKEVVVCYEAESGREVWANGWETLFTERLGGDGPRATPTIHYGLVYAYGAKGRLACLDGVTGSEKWAVETLKDNNNITWAMSGSPLIVDNKVIVNPGSQTEETKGTAVRAYNKLTGELIWQAGNYQAGYASPQYAKLKGYEQILIFDAHGVAGHDLFDGHELWRYRWQTYMGINVAQPIQIDDESIFICSDYSGEFTGGIRLKLTKDGEKWNVSKSWQTKNTVMRCKFTSPVRRKDSEGDYLYGLNDGILECIDLKTGKSMWKDERRVKAGEAYGHGQILLQDDLIICLTEFGELALVEATPKKFTELGRIKALNRGTKTWNNPSIVNGIIYLRNEVEMSCFDLREK